MKLIEHALCGYARLFVPVPDRCMVPIPLRAALELNVLGAPGATSVMCTNSRHLAAGCHKPKAICMSERRDTAVLPCRLLGPWEIVTF